MLTLSYMYMKNYVRMHIAYTCCTCTKKRLNEYCLLNKIYTMPCNIGHLWLSIYSMVQFNVIKADFAIRRPCILQTSSKDSYSFGIDNHMTMTNFRNLETRKKY